MKLKILLIVLTFTVITFMWFNSPMYKYENRPTVTVITPKTSDIYNSIVVRGNIEEGEKRSIRLDKTAKIEKINVKIGDEVKEGDVLFTTKQTDDIGDVQSVMNLLPEIREISDIESYYIPRYFTATTELKPKITAPINGVVTELQVKEGDMAIGQIPIVVISDFNNLLVLASVSEMYIKDVKVGQEAEISGDAFSGKKYKAKVLSISPVAKKKTTLTGTGETTIDVLLEITSKSTVLKPGYTVDAKILTEIHKNALSVPYSCIIQEGNTEYVFLIKDGKASKTEVKTGFGTESVVEIVKGIEKDDIVVLNPTDELEDKTEVKTEVNKK